MNTESITEKLHARAEAKLRTFCQQKFGGLFELCGEHRAERPEVSDELKQQGFNLGVKEPEKYPWHGVVWAYASECLFLMKQKEWREREVSEFMARIEQVSADVEELRTQH